MKNADAKKLKGSNNEKINKTKYKTQKLRQPAKPNKTMVDRSTSQSHKFANFILFIKPYQQYNVQRRKEYSLDPNKSLKDVQTNFLSIKVISC